MSGATNLYFNLLFNLTLQQIYKNLVQTTNTYIFKFQQMYKEYIFKKGKNYLKLIYMITCERESKY